MLQKIRKGLSSTIVFALLALLIASFALWGVGGGFVQQGAVVATVGSQEITIPEYRNAFNAEVRSYQEQYQTFTNSDALSIGLHRYVIEQLVQRASLDEEAKNLKLLGADDDVRRTIRELPYFQDLSGTFSEFVYRQQLTSAGWDIQEFEDQVRVDIARAQLIEGIAETSLVPATMLETLYTYRKEARRAEIATIPASAVGEIALPGEEVLRAYYEENKTNFMAPEYRDLSFLILTPADFAGDAAFTEEELRAEYESRLAEYNTPEMRGIEVAILKTEDEAAELIERVGAGEDFAAVAAELTGLERDEIAQDPVSYTDAFEAFGEQAARAIFDAEAGAVTEPIETLVSRQVFRVTEITPGIESPFEEVRDELRQVMAQELGIDALYDKLEDIDEELGAGASLEEIAVVAGVEPIRVEAISANGLLPNGETFDDFRIYPLLQEAFTKFPEDELEMPEGPNDSFYIIQVNEIIPPAQRSYEEVADEVAQLWRAQETLLRLGQRAREALAAAESGESLESIAARYGGDHFLTGSYVRDRVFTQREISPAIARLMFDLQLGEFGIEQDGRGEGYVVVKVVEVTTRTPEASDFEYQSLVSRLSAEVKNDLYAQFMRKVRDSIDVDINQTIVDTLFDPEARQTGIGVPSQ